MGPPALRVGRAPGTAPRAVRRRIEPAPEPPWHAGRTDAPGDGRPTASPPCRRIGPRRQLPVPPRTTPAPRPHRAARPRRPHPHPGRVARPPRGLRASSRLEVGGRRPPSGHPHARRAGLTRGKAVRRPPSRAPAPGRAPPPRLRDRCRALPPLRRQPPAPDRQPNAAVRVGDGTGTPEGAQTSREHRRTGTGRGSRATIPEREPGPTPEDPPPILPAWGRRGLMVPIRRT